MHCGYFYFTRGWIHKRTHSCVHGLTHKNWQNPSSSQEHTMPFSAAVWIIGVFLMSFAKQWTLATRAVLVSWTSLDSHKSTESFHPVTPVKMNHTVYAASEQSQYAHRSTSVRTHNLHSFCGAVHYVLHVKLMQTSPSVSKVTARTCVNMKQAEKCRQVVLN